MSPAPPDPTRADRTPPDQTPGDQTSPDQTPPDQTPADQTPTDLVDRATRRAQALLLRSGIRSAAERELGHPINFNKWIDTLGGPKTGHVLLLERLETVLQQVQQLVRLIDGAAFLFAANRATVTITVPAGPAIILTFLPDGVRLGTLAGNDNAPREIGVFGSTDLGARAALSWVADAAWGEGWTTSPAESLVILPPADGHGYRLVDPLSFGGAWPDIAAESDALALSRVCTRPVAELLAAATARAQAARAQAARAESAPAESDRAQSDAAVFDAEQRAVRARHRDRVRGSLLGGAIGDALGYPVEFWPYDRILEAVGPAGVRDYRALPSGERGVVSDDTQMTLFTADALARHHTDPGTTIMAALSQITNRSVPVPNAQNDSKGSGTVMRSAPFGLVLSWTPESAYAAAAGAAAVTHGHPVAQVAAGALAVMVRLLVAGGALEQSVLAARDYADAQESRSQVGRYTSQALEVALRRARDGAPSRATLETLGAGWIAEEALGIAVYCALAYPGAEQMTDALALAVTHSGDSDSTGAICGNLLGALHGEAALPPELLAGVEGLATIRAVANALADRAGPTPDPDGPTPITPAA